MNINNGALYFGAGIDLVQWRRDIDSMRRDILGLTQTTVRETGQMDSAFKNLSIGIAGYFSASMLKDFTIQLINVRGEFQKTEVAFATMLGDGDKAKDLMEQMVELAAKTPFSLQDVSLGAKQLLAFQIPANEVLDTLTRMGNIASGLSVPISRINLVFGQVKAKGRLMGDDLRQFTEAGIPMVAELAKKFNKTTAEISDMVTAGKIGFKDVKEVLFSLTDEGGMFFNLMEKQSATLSGRVSNLGDEFSQMLNKIGQNQEGLLSSGIDGVTNLIEHYEDISNVLLVLISTYGAYRAALIATVAIQRASIVAGHVQAFLQLASSIRSARDAQILFSTVTKANPYVIAATALAALSAALYVYYNRVSEAEKAQQELNAEISKQQAPIAATKTKIDSLVSAIKQENVSNSQRAEWLKQIKVLSNGRLNQLTVEEIRTNKASNAINGYIQQLQKEAEAKAYLTRITDYTEKREQLRAKLKTKLTAGDLLDDLTDFATASNDKNGKGLSTLQRRNIRILNEINAQSGEIQKARDKVARLTKEGTNTSDVIADADTTKAENNAKKVKKELAEIYSLNSIADLEQRIDLWNEALRKASGDSVNVLSKDKFGDVFKTGKTVSVSEAVSEVAKLEEAKAKREKEIQIQSFQDRLDETKRQIEVRDKLLKAGYDKEVVDEMFPAVKDKSFLQYLNETGTALEKLKGKESAENLVKLQGVLSDYTGAETFIENVNKQIDELKAKFSGNELIDKLENFKKANLEGTTGDEKNAKNIAVNRAQEEERLEQKQAYNEFVKEYETFEQKKLQIEKKYNNLRAQIGENTNLSDLERLRLLDAAGKREAKEYRDAFVSVLEKSDMFEKVFGNIDALTKKEISKYIPELEAKINELINLGAPAQEVEKFREKLEKLKDLSNNSGPIRRLIESFKELRKKIREGTATQEDFNRLNQHIQETKFYTDLAINSAKELSEVLGIDGKGGPFEKFAKDLTQTIEGLINALVGYFSGNIQQMVGGIAQMVVGIVKMLSTAGDGKKEKSIRSWKRAVDELKSSYEELQRVIEKTAGEAQLSKQRELISNLKEQQNLLIQMREKESQKKKKDLDKIASYNQQINDVNIKIQEIVDDFRKTVTTTDFKDLSQKLADSLINAFAQGEDAAKSFDKVVDDVMKNAVVNALRIKYLEPVAQDMIDKLYSSMGYGKGDTADKFAQIKQYEEEVRKLDEKIKNNIWGNLTNGQFEDEKKKYLQLIDKLKAEIANTNIAGSFDGLAPDEIKQLKDYKNDPRIKELMEALNGIDKIFDTTINAAQGLKGDIKGITEKTAGALEGQFNAVRINISEVLKIMKGNQTVANAQTVLLSKIESNTSNLIQMRKDIAELNSKVKNSLAGIP